jgi:hypothetical protein
MRTLILLLPLALALPAQTMAEKALATPAGARVEIRLLSGAKRMGRLEAVETAGVRVRVARGQAVETEAIAFTDMRSYRAVPDEGRFARGSRRALTAFGGVMALTITLGLIAIALN